MKNFFKKIKDIYHHEELRKKILITFGFILIYRVGSFIVLPGVNSDALEAQMSSGPSEGLGAILTLFTGGAFSRASIFALGIMPYISASIIIQLLSIAVPSVQKLQKEGESGRKKINQWTRFLTIAITLVQAPGYLASSVTQAVADPSPFWWFSAVAILTCSTLLIMWLGERITDKGIGNGISLLIMIGIIATFPQAIIQEFAHPNTNLFFFLVEIAALLVVIGLSVALVQAVRRVPVQMAKNVQAGTTHMPMGEGQRSYIPLKVNSSGVMPIIFAQAIMFVPLYLTQTEAFQDSELLQSMGDFNGLLYNVIFFLMIVIFTYFYTAITVNPNQMADDLKRQGSFVPGIKPGRSTAEFLDGVLSRITLPGSIFLGLIAILPAIVFNVGLTHAQGFAIFFGGTSLLIMVGVVLDTLQQVESYLLSRHYDGLMKSGKMRGRQNSPVSGIAG
ncbi:MAG: preprotein translocase subunit SecY [Flavobacteriales bacterium]|nr:preprotein translocase subunit SecY [Flavobacteriales bacterium]MDG1781514.1 preprotein translocase subunit SecY [Flavobacteriales bacterium]MDG2246091.1 preprotein translocase subunit SecY [Flavobacteriales bacterium]